jgi:peptidoglycan/LPS O-acetylase OafA/YrhL
MRRNRAALSSAPTGAGTRESEISTLDQQGNNFDFLRLFLAFLVIYSHGCVLATGSYSREPLFWLTHGQVTCGDIAVDAFFIISGFLITASFERSRTLLSYFKKRVFRIYPAFIVVNLLCALCVLPLSGGSFLERSAGVNLLDFILQTARLREFHYVHAFAGNVYPGGINGSVWTIFYEFFCYIALALLGLSGILRANRVLLGILAATIVVSLLFAYNHWTLAKHFARFLPLFMAGVVFYRFRQRIPLRTSWMICALLLLALAARLPYGLPLALPLAGAYLIFAVAFHPHIRLHRIGRFGDFSYGTYLYAYPIQQLIMHWIGRPISPLLLFALAASSTLCIAVCSWYGVERWFLHRSHGSSKAVLPLLCTEAPEPERILP